ncbi:hypothetical protein P3T76_014882 [Phytophthora citrophthora]|uniref:Bzip transcription factor n=1 Tax=Phytophthora citrophthora TaxID=4793 RepID=A0AAD9G0Y9_9STRA|nr:hypothetical protein P3T76_014882 [Phytophthora citrophthora]
MQRYRLNLQDREGILEKKVQLLKEEIPSLQLQRDTIQAKGKGGTMWNIAAEYFRLFHHGLKEHQATRESSEGAPLARSQTQKGFLYAVLAPGVIGMSGFGVEKLLDDYRTLAFCLQSMSTRLVRLTTGAEGSIQATTRVEFVVTENSLRLAFPHLVTGGKVSLLASKLLGQRFVTRGSIRFEWDNDIGRVSLLQANLLTPMLELFGDLEMVSSVFKDALITPECAPTRSDEEQ